MQIITRDDFIDIASKATQRGVRFVLGKIRVDARGRTKSSFNEVDYNAANWWSIPAVSSRLRERVTGDPSLGYEDYVVERYLKHRCNLRLVSLGCGVGTHELRFARHHEVFSEVLGIDISEKLVAEANNNAQQEKLANLRYEVKDVGRLKLEPNSADVVLFHASLHHFSKIENLLGDLVFNLLSPDGLLVINDYVGPSRLQLTANQRHAVNEMLKSKIPEKYSVRLGTGWKKKRVVGPGRIRMLISDPSEAVESEMIMPTIRHFYDVVEQKALGGNILSPLLKDIAHHFMNGEEEALRVLQLLFEEEDRYLSVNDSDLVFGVYRKKKIEPQ
jgi:2-polyprenyl-3-methyl-5-hydroxy-6-metoxy-1,4-benzoquinol methylase